MFSPRSTNTPDASRPIAIIAKFTDTLGVALTVISEVGNIGTFRPQRQPGSSTAFLRVGIFR